MEKREPGKPKTSRRAYIIMAVLGVVTGIFTAAPIRNLIAGLLG